MNKVDKFIEELCKALEGNTDWPVRVELDKDEELTTPQHLVLTAQMRERGYKVWIKMTKPDKWTIDNLEISPL